MNRCIFYDSWYTQCGRASINDKFCQKHMFTIDDMHIRKSLNMCTYNKWDDTFTCDNKTENSRLCHDCLKHLRDCRSRRQKNSKRIDNRYKPYHDRVKSIKNAKINISSDQPEPGEIIESSNNELALTLLQKIENEYTDNVHKLEEFNSINNKITTEMMNIITKEHELESLNRTLRGLMEKQEVLMEKISISN